MTDQLSDERVRDVISFMGAVKANLTGIISDRALADYGDAESALEELLELRAKLSAYKQLDAAQCAQLTSYRKEDRRDHAARSTLESEREANRLLTEENERLRAKLAAGPDAPIHEERQMNKDGPVMPRVPSDDLLRRYTSHKINSVEARAIYFCIRDYLSFREKVEQAQNTSSSQGGRYDQAEDALYLTKVVRSGPEPIESPWAEDE